MDIDGDLARVSEYLTRVVNLNRDYRSGAVHAYVPEALLDNERTLEELVEQHLPASQAALTAASQSLFLSLPVAFDPAESVGPYLAAIDRDLPPLRTFGYQAAFQAGLNAAIASLGAIFARGTTGKGQQVEVSAQECLVTILELTYPFWPYMGLIASRLGQKPIQPLDFLECRDGWIYVCCIEEHQWRQFVDLMSARCQRRSGKVMTLQPDSHRGR